jgi:hypothetical protein
MTSRALSLLAAFASPLFMCAAIAGWLYDLWPANPLTLAVSALVVVGGPLVGIVHVVTAKDYEDEEVEEETVAPTAPMLVHRPAPVRALREPSMLTPKAAAAARFAAWRSTPNDAITQRERERRASQYIRS